MVIRKDFIPTKVIRAVGGARQINALTSLRFFAAFYVLVFHSGGHAVMVSSHLPQFFTNLLRNGYIGVNFFFVLSGFILAYVYHGKLEDTYFSDATYHYGVARFARIYPVYLLALVAATLAAHTAWTWMSVPQLILLQCWLPPNNHVPLANDNGPAWTLSVELLFYLSFPMLLKVTKSKSTRGLIALTGTTIVVMLLLRTASMGTGHEGWDLTHSWLGYVPLPLLRLPEFFYGVLLGALYQRSVFPARSWMVYAAICAALIILSISNGSWVPSMAAITFGVIILCVTASPYENHLVKILDTRVLVTLGGASYSLYLLQQPVHMYLWNVAGLQFPAIAKAIYAPVLIVISVLTFRFYETALREDLRRLLTRRTTSIAENALATEERPG